MLLGIFWTVIAGVIIGALYKKGSASAVKSISTIETTNKESP